MPIAKDEDDKESDIELDRSATKQHLGDVTRMNYLGQHQSHILFGLKELSRSMAKLTAKDSLSSEED